MGTESITLNNNAKIYFDRSQHDLVPPERHRRICRGTANNRKALVCDTTVYLRERGFILQRSASPRDRSTTTLHHLFRGGMEERERLRLLRHHG